jgi:S-adenosylmethionine:tRNA ribosyltransferase-isomerase
MDAGTGMPAGDRGDEPFLDYDLPDSLVAQHPPACRGQSRLMTVERAGGRIAHARFESLGDLLSPGDLLVLNDTRVVPARVMARKRGGGGRVEVLFLDWVGPAWRGIARGKVRRGALLDVSGWDEPLEVLESVDGEVAVGAPADDPLRFFEAVGRMPLPPYIEREPGEDDPEDRARYQTVFARSDGSVAAPTAGLHFTPEILAHLGGRGIGTVSVTLHVGWGTFSPLRGDWRQHRIHAEWGEIAPDAAGRINATRAAGGRVVAVGTTSARLIESRLDAGAGVLPGAGATALYITPGFRFGVTDALLTNFHRPKSSLLLLVDAFAGSALMERAYGEAIRDGYRFFSYGDAMLIR